MSHDASDDHLGVPRLRMGSVVLRIWTRTGTLLLHPACTCCRWRLRLADASAYSEVVSKRNVDGPVKGPIQQGGLKVFAAWIHWDDIMPSPRSPAELDAEITKQGSIPTTPAHSTVTAERSHDSLNFLPSWTWEMVRFAVADGRYALGPQLAPPAPLPRPLSLHVPVHRAKHLSCSWTWTPCSPFPLSGPSVGGDLAWRFAPPSACW